MNLNPIRYRSYYYDTETNFYYLNARYYDPKVHRFISADSVIAGVSQGVTGYNLFAYCDNDPVNKTDASGNFPEWSEIATSSNCKKIAIGLAVITAVAVLTVVTGGSAASIKSAVEITSSVQQLNNVIPDKKDVMKHIFREADGHVSDPSFKSLFEKVANNPANMLGPDKFGNKWYAKMLSDGRQVWVEVRDGIIFDAGINNIAKYFNPSTGLKQGGK